MCICSTHISLIAIIEAILSNSMFISYICLYVFINAYNHLQTDKIVIFWGALNFAESSSCVAG